MFPLLVAAQSRVSLPRGGKSPSPCSKEIWVLGLLRRKRKGGASLWAPPNKDEMEREGGRGENGGVAPKKGEGKEEVITHLRASASKRSGGERKRVEKTHLLEKVFSQLGPWWRTAQLCPPSPLSLFTVAATGVNCTAKRRERGMIRVGRSRKGGQKGSPPSSFQGLFSSRQLSLLLCLLLSSFLLPSWPRYVVLTHGRRGRRILLIVHENEFFSLFSSFLPHNPHPIQAGPAPLLSFLPPSSLLCAPHNTPSYFS